MKEFIIDIFSEETPDGAGKFSAKRFMGILVGLLAGLGAVVSGVHWYNVSPQILNPMWVFSGAMLGVSIVKGMR